MSLGNGREACSNRLRAFTLIELLVVIGIALAGHEASAGAFPPGILASAWRSGNVDTNSTDLTGKIAAFGFFQWTYFLHELLPRLDEQAYYEGLRGPLFRIEWLSNTTGTGAAQRLYGKVDKVPIQSLLRPSDTQAPGLWATPLTGGGDTIPRRFLQLAKSNYLGFFSGTNVAESLSYIGTVPTVSGSWANQRVRPRQSKTAEAARSPLRNTYAG